MNANIWYKFYAEKSVWCAVVFYIQPSLYLLEEIIFSSLCHYLFICFGRKNPVMLATASMYLRKLSSHVKYGQLTNKSFQGG